MNYTQFLGLKLPEPEEYFDLDGHWNWNTTKIDEHLATVATAITNINTALTNLDGLPAELTAETTARTTADAKHDAALVQLIDNGAKNIANWAGSTSTISGVTFTIGSDGTVSTSGTASARATKQLNFTVPATLPAGDYVLAGCPAGGATTSAIYYCLYLMDITANARVTPNNNDTGNGFSFSWTPDSTHTYAIMVDIRNGTSAAGLKFTPMICSKAAWNISHKAVPYCPTLAELYAMVRT